MRILHLIGQREDNGGILSVIRSLQEIGPLSRYTHRVWVHKSYRETRLPPLSYRYSPFIRGDSPSHFSILIKGMLAFLSLRRLLARELFHVLHAHTVHEHLAPSLAMEAGTS